MQNPCVVTYNPHATETKIPNAWQKRQMLKENTRGRQKTNQKRSM